MRSSLWTGGNSHHAPNRTPGKLLKTFGAGMFVSPHKPATVYATRAGIDDRDAG